MKRLIIAAAFILLSGLAFGQTLQKGIVISSHTLKITLDPDVTMNQYLDFLKNKMMPEMEKHFPGSEMFLLKGFRGEQDNEYSFFWIFENMETHLKYWDHEGQATELGQAAIEKMGPTREEIRKLGQGPIIYTDWVIL